MTAPFEETVKVDGGTVRVVFDWPAKAAAWQYRCWIKGKRIYKSTRQTAKAKAIAFAEKEIKKAAQNETGMNGLKLGPTVTAFLDQRFPPDDPKRKYNRTYTNLSKRLTAWQKFQPPDTDLAKLDLDSMIDRIQAYLDDRRKNDGVAARTIQNDRNAIGALFSWLMIRRRREIPWRVNPADSAFLDLPKVDRVVKPPLARSLQQQVVERMRGKKTWPHIALCLGAGLRPIEAFRLEWKDVDFEQGLLQVTAKRKTRLVPLPAAVATELKALDQSVPLMPWVNMHWSKVVRNELMAEKFGKNVALQACRRTAAFRIAQEVDMMTYARIMGHSLQVAQNHYLSFDAMGDGVKKNILQPADWFKPKAKAATKRKRGKRTA